MTGILVVTAPIVRLFLSKTSNFSKRTTSFLPFYHLLLPPPTTTPPPIQISQPSLLSILCLVHQPKSHFTIFSSFLKNPKTNRTGFNFNPTGLMETQSLILIVPNLPLFFSLYLTIYLIAYFVVFRNWSPKLRPEASSCAISLVHGTPAVILASKAIFSDPNRNFHSPNTTFQTLVLDYSVAYFLMDLCHYLIFYPSDVLFIGHHLATLFVFLTCRFVVYHGAYAILVLLILAEVTSFCQNSWTLANARRLDSEIAAKVYELLSPPFYALYSVVRGFAAPAFVYQMFVFYKSGVADDMIPKWVWISWTFVVFMAISVSLLWVSNLWVELYRNRARKIQKKIS